MQESNEYEALQKVADKSTECLRKITAVIDEYEFTLQDAQIIICALLMPLAKAYEYDGGFAMRLSSPDMEKPFKVEIAFKPDVEASSNEH